MRPNRDNFELERGASRKSIIMTVQINLSRTIRKLNTRMQRDRFMDSSDRKVFYQDKITKTHTIPVTNTNLNKIT